MIKLTIKEVVLAKLSEAFPKPANSAKRALEKYQKALAEKLTESLNKGQTEYERKMKLFSVSTDKLAAEGSRIGPDKVRVHAWLEQNNLSLVETVVVGSNLSGRYSGDRDR